MNALTSIGLTVTLSLSLIGCDDTAIISPIDPPVDPTTPTTPGVDTRIQGSWTTGCTKENQDDFEDETYSISNVTFEEEVFTSTNTLFTETNCVNPVAVSEDRFQSVTIVGTVEEPGLMISTELGFATFQNRVVTEVSVDGVRKPVSDLSSSFIEQYDIYLISGDRLYFGDDSQNDSELLESRPERLNLEEPLTRIAMEPEDEPTALE